MQYNNTHTPHLGALRNIVIKAASPLDAALEVSRYLNLTKGGGPGGCTDNVSLAGSESELTSV